MVDKTDVDRTTFQRFDPGTVSLQQRPYFDRFRARGFRPSDPSERFHEESKYVRGGRVNGRLTGAFHDDALARQQAALAPDYANRPRVSLPDPADEALDVTLRTALERRRSRRTFSGDPLSAARLSNLLHYACGVTGELDWDLDTKSVRAYPSPGALYPVEIYPLVLRGDDLDAGGYYYRPDDHELRRLWTASDDFETEVRDSLLTVQTESTLAGMSMLVVLTGAFWRAKAKYGPRGYRYALQESGHLAQNLQLAADALDLDSTVVGGFDDYRFDDLLGVDGVNESTVYAVAVGGRDGGETA